MSISVLVSIMGVFESHASFHSFQPHIKTQVHINCDKKNVAEYYSSKFNLAITSSTSIWSQFIWHGSLPCLSKAALLM